VAGDAGKAGIYAARSNVTNQRTVSDRAECATLRTKFVAGQGV